MRVMRIIRCRYGAQFRPNAFRPRRIIYAPVLVRRRLGTQVRPIVQDRTIFKKSKLVQFYEMEAHIGLKLKRRARALQIRSQNTEKNSK